VTRQAFIFLALLFGITPAGSWSSSSFQAAEGGWQANQVAQGGPSTGPWTNQTDLSKWPINLGGWRTNQNDQGRWPTNQTTEGGWPTNQTAQGKWPANQAAWGRSSTPMPTNQTAEGGWPANQAAWGRSSTPMPTNQTAEGGWPANQAAWGGWPTNWTAPDGWPTNQTSQGGWPINQAAQGGSSTNQKHVRWDPDDYELDPQRFHLVPKAGGGSRTSTKKTLHLLLLQVTV
jgi:hypothetical protein